MDDLERERTALLLFDELADITEHKREAWIAERTDGNLPLERRLRTLIAAERRANMRTGGAWLDEAQEPLPARIGAYRITGLIGRGGMGSVYRGERITGDFDHVVAIKVIKPGLLSEVLAERFRRERQTLAQLSHPNIAHLYDGGETQDGSPYIVMELVDGLSLARWVEDNGPAREDRLAMFGAICHSVGFAHRNLVVHRDITSSNVLVTADGTPKLIDFGIARAPDLKPSTEAARVPSIGSLSLTPGYAAPERMTSAAVSTSADIYSLGKLLAWLMSAQDAEFRAIIARATANDPDDRYLTAEALAEDVEAWAKGLPVAAMEGGRRYVLTKFIRRNRLPLGIAALALALLVSALVFALVANHRAQVARVDAETRFNDVRALASYMLFDLDDQLARVPGNTAARAALAEQAQTYLSALAQTPGSAPALQLETARGLLRLAEVQAVPLKPNLGEPERAQANLDRADALLARQPENEPLAQLHRGLSATHRGLILLHSETEENAARAALDNAEKSLSSAPVAGLGDAWHEAFNGLRLAQLELADVSDNRDHLPELLKRADADRADWSPAYRESFEARRHRALLAYYQALVFSDSDYDRATELHLAAEQLYDVLLAERRDDPLLLYRAAWNGLDGFAVASRAGLENVSGRLIEQAAQIIDRLALIDDRDDAVQALQSNIKEALAQNLRDGERFDEAIAVSRDVVALRKAAADELGTGGALGNLGFSQMILGVIARDAGHRDLACQSWKEAQESLRRSEATGAILGFHKGFMPGIDSHLKACTSGQSIHFPMR